jgi:putative oxidoreductase
MNSKLDKILEPYVRYAPVLIRITFGIHLIYYSGPSVLNLEAGDSAEFLESLGIPFPVLMSWVYVLTEFFGGIFLIIGFKIRWIAIPLVVTFIVASFIAHYGHPYEKSSQAYQLLAVSLFFLIRGAGALSIDTLLNNKI